MSEDARKKVDVKPDKTVIKALSQGGLLGGSDGRGFRSSRR